MARILAIDYGKRRTGLAWTDPLQIIATGIGSFDTNVLEDKIAELIGKEEIETLVLGMPTRMDGSDTHSTEAVRKFAELLRKKYPNIPLHFFDERLTSKIAKQAMIDGGLKRKRRRDKHLVNEISATLILQDFMQSH